VLVCGCGVGGLVGGVVVCYCLGGVGVGVVCVCVVVCVGFFVVVSVCGDGFFLRLVGSLWWVVCGGVFLLGGCWVGCCGEV